MKKYVGAIIGVVIILISLVAFFGQSDRGIREKKKVDYEEIINIYEAKSYDTSAADVVELYCKAEKLLYSTKFEKERNKDEMIENLLNIQMSLLDEELINVNGGKDFMKLKLYESRKKFLDANLKVIDTKMQVNPEIKVDDEGNIIKLIKVIQYVNEGSNSYKIYCVKQNEKGKWKIVTFQNTDEFVISK